VDRDGATDRADNVDRAVRPGWSRSRVDVRIGPVVTLGPMTRRQQGAFDEAEQIHAILRPAFVEVGAGERRQRLLAKGRLEEPLAWNELDLAIESLLTRMRVDPRPTQGKVPRPKEATRPQAAVPPPVPVVGRAPTGTDLKAPELKAPVGGDKAEKPEKKVPPPLPLPPMPEPPKLPGEARPIDELEVPPLPHASAEARQPRKPTGTLPVVPVEDIGGALVLTRPGNAPETFLLYDDIVNLSAMADRDGLLISLERLLVLAKLEDHVRQFVESNEVKLMGLYESELKAFSRTPKRRPPAVENTMPRAFLRAEKIAAVLPFVDGQATVTEIVRKSPLTPVETCSVICQLKRAGLIDV